MTGPPPAYSAHPMRGEISLEFSTLKWPSILHQSTTSTQQSTDDVFHPNNKQKEVDFHQETSGKPSIASISYIDSLLDSIVDEEEIKAKADEILKELPPSSNEQRKSPLRIRRLHTWKYSIQTNMQTDSVEKEASSSRRLIEADEEYFILKQSPKLVERDESIEKSQGGKHSRRTACLKKRKNKKIQTKEKQKPLDLFINVDHALMGNKDLSFQFLEECESLCLYRKVSLPGDKFEAIKSEDFSLCDDVIRKSSNYVSQHNQTAGADTIPLCQIQSIYLIPIYKVYCEELTNPLIFGGCSLNPNLSSLVQGS